MQDSQLAFKMKITTNKVCNKGTNEQIHGRNIQSQTNSQYHNQCVKENSLQHSCQVLYLNWEAAMREGVLSCISSPLKVIIYWWQKALFGRKSIFSSTGHRPASLCHGLLSVVHLCVCSSVRLCVNFFFKHLLWNYLLDFDEISQKCSCHGPLQNFLK